MPKKTTFPFEEENEEEPVFANGNGSTAKDAEAPSDSVDFKILIPQALVGLVDAMSFMVTAPSIVFYVLQNGGSYNWYGIILSSFSFSSFLFKPILGYWSDRYNTYRTPYLVSIVLAMIGGIIYYAASFFSHNATVAMTMILVSRLLGGMGAANQTLGYSYMALVVPQKQLTQANSMLSMVRVLGMTVAPALNIVLDAVPLWKIDNVVITTPLNSVGLFLVFGNLISFVAIYLFLQNPQAKVYKARRESMQQRGWRFWYQLLSLGCLIPIGSIFSLNANFQLNETCMAPVANHVLGWKPVEVSVLFGVTAVLICVAIVIVLQLSKRGVSDEKLLAIGLVLSIVGYTLMYTSWQSTANVVTFSLPVILATVAFPFLGSPTRSLFTRFIDGNEYLRHHQGLLQAVLSMVASIAGFTAPGFISAFILRTPEDVAASDDTHELERAALFAPILSSIVLAMLLYQQLFTTEKSSNHVDDESSKRDEESGELTATETTPLVPIRHKKLPPEIKAVQGHATTCMGIQLLSFQQDESNNTAMRRASTGSFGTLPLPEPLPRSANRRQSSIN